MWGCLIVNKTRIIVVKHITDKPINELPVRRWRLLTLVAVEVARDVDAFTSHHHYFVSWKIHNALHTSDKMYIYITWTTGDCHQSQMVVHVGFLMVAKLKQKTNTSSPTGLQQLPNSLVNSAFKWPFDDTTCTLEPSIKTYPAKAV